MNRANRVTAKGFACVSTYLGELRVFLDLDAQP